MENLSHSVLKNAYHGDGFGAKTVYDDVFGRPPKFGIPTLSSRVEDYGEIFGSFNASRASSIPILDLPAVDEAEFSFDVRSSMFDYSEVFGAFNGLDFAVSFEELFNQSKATCDSSDEVWTPAQSESLSDESDPSSPSERNQSLSNGESHQSYGGIKPFNISNNKASQRSKEDMSSGTVHTTQFHAVPGFTFVVNETPLSQKIEDSNIPLQVTDDLNPNMVFSGRLREGKLLRETMSHPLNSSFGMQTVESDLKPVGNTASHMDETFMTVSDISLRTEPSRLPPPSRPAHVLSVNDRDSDRQKQKLKASKSFAFGEMTGESSPPFFDVEVDASSSAAVSAAAMKDVMEKAQAKLRSAKELMERKECLETRTKLGLKNDTQVKEGKPRKTFDGSNSFKDAGVRGICQRDCSGMIAFAGDEVLKLMNTTGGKHIHVTKISADTKHGKEYRSSQEFYKTKGTVAWREAEQFYEVVETDKSRKIFEQAKDERVLVQNTVPHEHGQEKKEIPASQQREEDNRKIKADREACECDGNKGSSRREDNGKKVKINQEVCKQEETGKKPRMARQRGDIEKILTEAGKSEEGENLIEFQQKVNQMEVTKKLKEAQEIIGHEKRYKDAHVREENERRLKETLERGKYEERLKEAIERAEIENIFKGALVWEEKAHQQGEAFEREEQEKGQKEARDREEQRLKEALGLEEIEKRLKEALEWEESERLKMDLEQEENEKRQKLALERQENEKRLRKDLRQEEIDKILKGALEQEENAKKLNEAYEREENEERLNEACEREEAEKRLKEATEQEENKKQLQELHKREVHEKTSEEAFTQKEIEKVSDKANVCEETQKRIEDAEYWGDLKGQSKEHEQNERDESECKLKSDQGTFVCAEEENFKTSSQACKLDDHDNLQPGQATCKMENSLKVEKRNLSFEEDRTMRTEPIESRGWEGVEVVNVTFEDTFNSSGMAQDYSKHGKYQIKMKDAMESLGLHDTLLESVEADIGSGQTHNKKAPKIASNPGTPNLFTHELVERGTNVKEIQLTFDKEQSKDKLMPSQVAGVLIEKRRKMGADQPTLFEGKRNVQSPAEKVNTGQSTERKEKNLNNSLTPEERVKEERIKKERELEKDCLRKIEEEREREKDWMGVDRATLEAHERAFIEARGRAEMAAVERATVKVQQRVMVEARERLEKASAEARERSLVDKASMEARLRADCAAVERPTAEAREHAFQRAMAEKAASQAQEHVESSVADKSSPAYKNSGMRQSSSSPVLQNGVGSPSGSIYSCSSVHGASNIPQRFTGVEGESAQRCKARLERHRRTAERAAKALAEKNMRDLLDQRERAERTRLAETLNAEMKRWSSGKEGNLRALLSTLQYVLGPDSGWQPIPLTEVITAAALKKAYRKATLCVHPDKLQQRGASIQQKYICEKVFDLLKEAWNRFNSEDR